MSTANGATTGTSIASDIAVRGADVDGGCVSLDGETYYQIANSHLMDDFFMSLVGAGDHWMFVSSNGALTAGRRDPDLALFPYAADDQISAARSHTGSITLVRDKSNPETVWEPFAVHEASRDQIRRNLYKTPLGNKLVFEEVNETRQLLFRYRWTFSKRFGFVRSCHLQNTGDKTLSLDLLDGLQNLLPYGIGSDFLMRFSNLANAYKKNELIPLSNVGLYYLSSIPTDRAEPSEGLKSTVVWQSGLNPDAILLSSEQVPAFRQNLRLKTETDIRGKAGAFLASQAIELGPGESMQWEVVADLAKDHCDIVQMDKWLQETTNPTAVVARDVSASEQDFTRIVASSDGLQCGENKRRVNRHLSNTVFNVMRGGVPVENYRIDRDDFVRHVQNFNRETASKHEAFLASLPGDLTLATLQESIAALADQDMTRLGMEYLPLAFSRRHGDPTRPWNRFLIDLESDSGKTSLNYQGNWRDIFQNWEALLVSFPMFCKSMICRFVNATTADGYNPYRLTKDGFEWEEPEPDDPWSNIGYWGDHQIIYLLKLLEWARRSEPGGLNELLGARVFTHANVPYRIKDFTQIKQNAYDTIDFDAELNAAIHQRVEQTGSDGKLLHDQTGAIHYVTLVEKILTLSLAKLSNFIPDGGIWLNTQRPEWNDANNALVGDGLSMVTTCYLHRWFDFLHGLLESDGSESYDVSPEVAEFFAAIDRILRDNQPKQDQLSSQQRAQVVNSLSTAGSDFRNKLYADGLGQTPVSLSRQQLVSFVESAQRHLAATILKNRRPDGLYHAYNLVAWRDDQVDVEYLYEMLEGQVAVLSSGVLAPDEADQLLTSLRRSALYREDQDSYVLYPNRQLPRFMDKNCLDAKSVESNALLQRLLACDDRKIVSRDVRGDVHFNGSFRNSADLQAALESLGSDFQSDVGACGPQLVEMFQDLFGHRQFTGRSSTFFAYEGLGSIYWHMVSKLGLAVSENHDWAVEANASTEVIDSLADHLQAVRRGIGAEKTPSEYGAFPSDPYSHSPENAGVKQPGMTGQVKEDVLARFAEIGVRFESASIRFEPRLFDRNELLSQPTKFMCGDVHGNLKTIDVPKNGFAFTLCQVPVVYQPADADAICLHLASGDQRHIDKAALDADTAKELFSRSGSIVKIDCFLASLSSRH